MINPSTQPLLDWKMRQHLFGAVVERKRICNHEVGLHQIDNSVNLDKVN
jgi:hypothetical protein